MLLYIRYQIFQERPTVFFFFFSFFFSYIFHAQDTQIAILLLQLLSKLVFSAIQWSFAWRSGRDQLLYVTKNYNKLSLSSSKVYYLIIEN